MFRRTHLLLRRHRRPSYLIYGSLSVLSLGLLSATTTPPRKASDPSLPQLVRSYVVFTICSFPRLVDASPWLMHLVNVPVLGSLVRGLVRVTFFDHFVGGDTVKQTLPLISTLRNAHKGTLLAYSVEVNESNPSSPASPSDLINEMIHSVSVAADFEDSLSSKAGRRTWVAVKLSALVSDPQSLLRLSAYITRRAYSSSSSTHNVPFPGCPDPSDLPLLSSSSSSPPGTSNIYPLTPTDISDLRALYTSLQHLCTLASERRIRIIIDAEYTWYQPAIDLFVRGLSAQFNSLHGNHSELPLVYGTYQAYLRRTPAQLKAALEDANKHGYALGVKLVRGAYHPHELAAWTESVSKPTASTASSISPDTAHPPVWGKKEDTDRCYNACVDMLVEAVGRDIMDIASSSSPHPLPRKTSWLPSFLSTTGSLPPIPTQTIGVLFGTHNWASCRHLLRELGKRGLVRVVRESEPNEGDGNLVVVGDDDEDDMVVHIPRGVVQRVCVGQLFGMSDDLTNHMVKRTVTEDGTPFVIKYVPYGALAEVMPYLSRRAIENKSVLGGGIASLERSRAGREIWKRVVGGGLWRG